MTLDDNHFLRLAKADWPAVEVVQATIKKFWPLGLDAEGQIACGKGRAARPLNGHVDEEKVSWEFVLKGSPWELAAAKIGQARQLITFLLDALLANGWMAVTGMDISRSLNKRSAVMFRRCQPLANTTLRHACLSPLGKQHYQLINAPASLRRLVREEFKDLLMHEKITEHQAIWEMTLSGRRWWTLNPEQERESYIFIRNRMGRLLQALMDAGWHLVASFDVAREVQEDNDPKGGIHTWFVVYCGDISSSDMKQFAIKRIKKLWRSVDELNGRASSMEASTDGEEREQGKSDKSKRSPSAARSNRIASPVTVAGSVGKRETRRSRSGHNLLNGVEPFSSSSTRQKLTNAMKSNSAAA